ncbi:hypothetical protein FE236_07875 [Mariprofundus erugo]|uniref:hypothetical protein n=1 Tax=Mariprofundus erugo TaxID=2528639 RepID=UPI0010FDEA19|nr:hypothetical protein [Mariprofundus erugo]TLS76042.1 hypothetical protein FE236_07875 [Mariprofundus erugo]
MNVLILHGLGKGFVGARSTSLDHILCFQRYAPEHEYVYIDIQEPVSYWLTEFPFDLIVIDGTFLCWRWVRPRSLLDDIKEKYNWICNHPAVKIAFPQDDYDHSKVLDQWLYDLKVDCIYSVCTGHHDILYPLCSQTVGRIGMALTGYVDDALLKAREAYPPLPLQSRSIDIGYRARNLPAYFGRHGQIKVDLGRRFKEIAEGSKLRIDVSLDEKDVLTGAAWGDFLRDSKFTLGCESGSSVIDPEGEVRAAIEKYLIEFPGAPFEQISKDVLSGVDGVYVFSSISPRVFEASIFGSCQILVEGTYLDGMRPGEHYIEIKRDYSNVHEVLELVGDLNSAQQMECRLYKDVIKSKKYMYSTRVSEVFSRVDLIKANKGENPRLELWRAEIGNNKMFVTGAAVSLLLTQQEVAAVNQQVEAVSQQVEAVSQQVEAVSQKNDVLMSDLRHLLRFIYLVKSVVRFIRRLFDFKV